jgi:CHASE3 domain sensor protein
MTTAKVSSAKLLAPLAGVLVLMGGGTVLAGWAFDIATLKSILPGWVSMKPNEALAFILMGFALLLPRARSASDTPLAELVSRLGRMSGWLVGLIGVMTLLEYTTGWSPGLDQWLIRESSGTVGTSHPGRMAPDAALCFLLLAVEWEIAHGAIRRQRHRLASAAMSSLVFAIALVAILAYFTPGVGAFGWMGLTIMAATSAGLFVILGMEQVYQAWRECDTFWFLSRKNTAAFAGGLLLIVSVGLCATRSHFYLRETIAQVTQNEKILNGFAHIANELGDIQVHAGSLLIAGDERSLEFFKTENDQCLEAMESLRQLIADHPHQKLEFARFEAEVRVALESFQRGLDRHRAGAIPQYEIRQATDFMNNLVALTERLENRHGALIRQTKWESERVAAFSDWINFAGMGGILGFFLMALSGMNLAMHERVQAENDLLKNQRLLAQTERMGKVGGWEFEVATGRQTWTEEIYHIHELSLTYQPTVENGINFYAPSSQPIIERAVQRAIELGESYDLELDIITAKGNLRHVHAIGAADPARHKVFGFFQDITARKQAEEKTVRHLEELQRWQDLMLDREDRVMEFKREVNDLCRRLKESDRYASPEGALAHAGNERPIL